MNNFLSGIYLYLTISEKLLLVKVNPQTRVRRIADIRVYRTSLYATLYFYKGVAYNKKISFNYSFG